MLDQLSQRRRNPTEKRYSKPLSTLLLFYSTLISFSLPQFGTTNSFFRLCLANFHAHFKKQNAMKLSKMYRFYRT